MIGFQVFEWLVCLVEVLTGILINASVSANKIYWKKSLCASGIAAAIAWGLNQYQLFSFITTIVGIMGIAVSSIIIYIFFFPSSSSGCIQKYVMYHMLDTEQKSFKKYTNVFMENMDGGNNNFLMHLLFVYEYFLSGG